MGREHRPVASPRRAIHRSRRSQLDLERPSAEGLAGASAVLGQAHPTAASFQQRSLLQMQRTHGNRFTARQLQQRPGDALVAQRAVELRPPGRGEASAFERRQELVDRLNGQSPAIQYSLAGRVLQYQVVDEGALTHFDQQMRDFIDRAEVVPMRLITKEGMVGDRGRGYSPLLIDGVDSGYVDLDDMLASDDLSLRMNILHILTERFGIRNYERRIGTGVGGGEFNRAHRAGIDAETAHLRSFIGDPSIRFVREHSPTEPGDRLYFVFRSSEGYRIIHIFAGEGRTLQGGEVYVRTRDNRRITVDELRQERARAAEREAEPAPAGP